MKTIWSQIQARLREILPEAEYSVWIATLDGEVQYRNEIPCLVLYARNTHIAKYLRKYSVFFQEAAAKVLEIENSALIDVAYEALNADVAVIKPFSSEDVAKSIATAPAMLATGSNSQLLLPFQYTYEQPFEFKYSFDDFVVGPSNKLAVAATENIITDNALTNMLFLSSCSGLGKTHLIQAVGMAMQEKTKNSALNVVYLTAETFTSQFVQASFSKDFDNFKKRFAGCNLLLLEDVHFFQGKDKTQEMLLSIIKSIHSRGGKVVLTSSFAPKEIAGLDSYLASQFHSGFVASIEKPEMETRFHILVEKSKKLGLILPGYIAELMAKRIDADVRMLESCLQNVVFRAKVLGTEITEDIVYDVIQQVSQTEPSFDLPSIVDMVCKGFGVTRQQLESNSRCQNYVLARNLAFYLLRKHTDMTLEEIGHGFNRRHSTVIKGISSLEEEVSKESPVGRQLNDLIEKIEKNCGQNKKSSK